MTAPPLQQPPPTTISALPFEIMFSVLSLARTPDSRSISLYSSENDRQVQEYRALSASHEHLRLVCRFWSGVLGPQRDLAAFGIPGFARLLKALESGVVDGSKVQSLILKGGSMDRDYTAARKKRALTGAIVLQCSAVEELDVDLPITSRVLQELDDSYEKAFAGLKRLSILKVGEVSNWEFFSRVTPSQPNLKELFMTTLDQGSPIPSLHFPQHLTHLGLRTLELPRSAALFSELVSSSSLCLISLEIIQLQTSFSGAVVIIESILSPIASQLEYFYCQWRTPQFLPFLSEDILNSFNNIKDLHLLVPTITSFSFFDEVSKN